MGRDYGFTRMRTGLNHRAIKTEGFSCRVKEELFINS